jgi:phage baseplate assembly protein gpV
VFNQAFQGITTPQSTAPLYSPGMSVNFYRFGSGARIPLPCDASIVALAGSSITETVYWDTTNLRLTTTSTSNFAVPCKILRISTSGNKIVNYNSGTGNANWSNTIVGGSSAAPVAVVLI